MSQASFLCAGPLLRPSPSPCSSRVVSCAVLTSDDRFSIKSDVWSFGVLLTELVTYGAKPYEGLSNPEVVSLVKKGQRMDRPPGCPETLYAIMLECWKEVCRAADACKCCSCVCRIPRIDPHSSPCASAWKTSSPARRPTTPRRRRCWRLHRRKSRKNRLTNEKMGDWKQSTPMFVSNACVSRASIMSVVCMMSASCL